MTCGVREPRMSLRNVFMKGYENEYKNVPCDSVFGLFVLDRMQKDREGHQSGGERVRIRDHY